MTLRPAAAGGVSRFTHAQSPVAIPQSPRRRFAGALVAGLLAALAPAWAQQISIDSVSVAEGNVGPTTITFTVSVEPPTDGVSVDWDTADDTATVADNDYAAGSGTVNLSAAAPTATVDVIVNGDLVGEPDETFFVNLSNPVNATIAVAQGVGTIINDDLPPGVTVTLTPEGVLIITSTVPALDPPSKPDPADEYFRGGCEVIPPGSVVPETPDDPATPEDDSQEALPDEETEIIQIWYNETPLIIPGVPPLDNEDALDALACEDVERVVILAGPGDDVVDMSALLVPVTMYGEDGNDVLIGGTEENYAIGGPGNDLILGAGPFVGPDGLPGMAGGSGDDILLGGPEDDIIDGGLGNDVIAGRKGADTLSGGGGFDMVDYMRDGGPQNVVASLGTPGDATDTHGTKDVLWGFSVLRGSGLGDTLTSYQNASGGILLGAGGNDTLNGGPFTDYLYGEFGSDTIFSTPNNASNSASGDYMFGGSGNDTIYGSNQPDDIYGDGDALDQDFNGDPDFLNWADHPLNAIWGFSYQIMTSYELYTLLHDYSSPPPTPLGEQFLLPCADITAAGNDTIFGGAGNDWIAGGAGDDYIHGGNDPDLIFGDRVVNRPSALLAFGSWGPFNPMDPPDIDPEYDDVTTSFYGNDDIKGGAGNDQIFGGNGDDRINGDADNDIIYGDIYFGGGDQKARDLAYNSITTRLPMFQMDAIRGNDGFDIIFGGPDDDTLAGDDDTTTIPPGDIIQGNAGNDTIIGCRPDPNYVVEYDFDQPGPPNEGRPTPTPDYGNLAVELMSLNAIPNEDKDAADTVDYHMVPPAENGGIGADIDLGYDDPGGAFSLGYALDGEGGVDYLYGIENVIGTRHADRIMGSTRNDASPLTGRDLNEQVYDAFMVQRFPRYPTHPSGAPLASYYRNPLGRTLVYSREWDYGYDNILLGEDGDDIILGRRGSDALCGGNGNDRIWGDGNYSSSSPPPDVINPDDPSTAGYDEIWGDAGDDELYGEWGNDLIHGGAGYDYMSGGNGVDTLAFSEADEAGPVVVNLRQEPIDLNEWGDVAQTYAGYNWPLDPIATILPPGGWPAFDLTIPDDTIDGASTTLHFPGGSVLPGSVYNAANIATGRGLGTARVNGFYDVIVNRHLNTGTTVPPNGVINPDRFEIIHGGTLGDVIYGHDVAGTELRGQGGNDILVGGAGNDTIYGETTADDTLRGAAGSDVLEGRGGNDVLVGSAPPPTPPGLQWETPSDWVSYKDAPAGVTVNLAETEAQDTVAAGVDKLTEIQNALGSPFADSITGNWRANTILGDAGDDLLVGRSDYDIVQHNRTYILSDTLHGGPGNDTADYRHGNPAQVAAAAAQLVFEACPAPNGTDTCGYMSSDGEGGTDTLVNLENVRTPDGSLVLTPPAKKVISPGQSVRLDFYVSGGDGQYRAEFDPTVATKDNLAADGTKLGTKKVAILVEPASQTNPTTPFELDVDIPDYQAVRTITGNPAANGSWRFTVYARPLVTTSFRVTVSDMNDPNADPDAPASKQVSRVVEVVVAEELEVSIEQPEYIITAGQEIQLRGTATGGVTPYIITWEADNGSQGTTLSATNILIPIAKPTVTTKYTLRVQDSAPDSLSQVQTATTKVTVLPSGSNPSGSQTPTGTGGSTTGGNTNTGTNTGGDNTPPANEVTGTEEADAAPVAPMCGFGVTSWVLMGNLLLLAVMKRRRW